jgi:hypothetical protein
MTQAELIELLEKADEFGPMHIVVGDGNMEDSSLEFVEREMQKRGATRLEWKLLVELEKMTIDERYELWDAWTAIPEAS